MADDLPRDDGEQNLPGYLGRPARVSKVKPVPRLIVRAGKVRRKVARMWIGSALYRCPTIRELVRTAGRHAVTTGKG